MKNKKKHECIGAPDEKPGYFICIECRKLMWHILKKVGDAFYPDYKTYE